MQPFTTSDRPTHQIHTIYLPSPLPHTAPTPIATLLPTILLDSLINSSSVPNFATPYPSSPSYEILRAPSKGFGMFATRPIKAGELILDEHPVLIAPERPLPHNSPAWDDLGQALPEQERTEMLTMANCRSVEECPSPVEGIVRTNALVLDLTPESLRRKGKGKGDWTEGHGERYGGVFLKINRCNHSCGPNAAHKWDVSNLSSKLYALRPIEPSEEITIIYTDVTQSRDIRRAELQRNHRFLCTCPYCSPVLSTPPSPALRLEESVEDEELRAIIASSDENRRLLRHWLSTHPSFPKWSTDLCRDDDTVISSHRLALSLIDKEGVHFLQHIFLEELALSFAILGELDDFQFWAREFIQKCAIEDPQRAREFESWLEEPNRYKKWGWRRKQKSLQSKRASSPVYGYSPLMF